MADRKRRFSLNEKLIVYFVFFGIAGMILVEIFAFQQASDAMLTRTFNQLTSVRKVKASLVETYFYDRLLDARLIAGSDLFLPNASSTHTEVVHLELRPEVAEMQDITKHFLITSLKASGYYSWIALVDETGLQAYISLNEQSDMDEATSAVAAKQFLLEGFRNPQPGIHDVKGIGPGYRQLLFVAAQLNTTMKAFVLLGLNDDVLNKIMLEKNPADGLGESGESYLVGSDRLMRTQSRFGNNPGVPIMVNTKAVEEALQGHESTEAIADYRNVKVLSSWGKISQPDLNWVIIAEMDYAEALAPVNALRNSQLIIGLIVTIVIFVFAFLFSRRITGPILLLNKAAKSIQDGHFNLSLEVTSNDEIGELTASFNEMASQLGQQKEMIATERRRRLRSMLDGQEQERQRLSKELHDGLGQSLVAIRMQIEGVEGRCDPESTDKLEKTKQFLDQTIEETRRISNNLAPGGLMEFGLPTALRNLCSNLQEQSGKPVTFAVQGEAASLARKTLVYAFRIAQEALNNAVRHADCTNISLTVNTADKQMLIRIVDNGKGFDADKASHCHGNGLANMRERASLINAILEVETSQGAGTRVNLILNLDKNT
ncbi:MAG: HAMP domain-containing protein [Bacteroidales bacterium]|nr:HAMP domain-containing protein [Bacteroidales bacterium]